MDFASLAKFQIFFELSLPGWRITVWNASLLDPAAASVNCGRACFVHAHVMCRFFFNYLTGSGQPVHKLKTNVHSSSRPLCTSMCLQCSQMNCYTANTPTLLTPIRPQMYSDLCWSSIMPSPGWRVIQQHRIGVHVYPFTLWCSTRCTTSSWTCCNSLLQQGHS